MHGFLESKIADHMIEPTRRNFSIEKFLLVGSPGLPIHKYHGHFQPTAKADAAPEFPHRNIGEVCRARYVREIEDGAEEEIATVVLRDTQDSFQR